MSEVREYNAGGEVTEDVMPAGASHVQVYINGGGAPGQNGNGVEGGDGGGGGAFACFDVDTTPGSPYTITINGSQSHFNHIRDNNATTGQSAAWAARPPESKGRSFQLWKQRLRRWNPLQRTQGRRWCRQSR